MLLTLLSPLPRLLEDPETGALVRALLQAAKDEAVSGEARARCHSVVEVALGESQSRDVDDADAIMTEWQNEFEDERPSAPPPSRLRTA